LAPSPRDDQVGEILDDLASVGHAFGSLDVEPRRESTIRGDGDGEGLQNAGRAARPILPAGLRRKLQKSATRELSHAQPKVRVPRDLRLDRDPPLRLGADPELAEQHGLADTAQARDDHRLIGGTAGEARQQDIERREFVFTTYHRRRTGAGVGRVGVITWVHGNPYFFSPGLSLADKPG
jgi:hypothetical protein